MGRVNFLLVIARVALIIGLARAVDIPRCNKGTFESVFTKDETIESIKAVAKGEEYGEGRANPSYPNNPKNLPELCAVTVNVVSSSNSSFRVGLFLPTDWNNRFLAVGNGGFAGGINWLDMAPGAHYGFATVSTDTGHNSSVTQLTWAYKAPERREDWGWRAIHGSVVLGKKLAKAYYGKAHTFSYWNGCSTGGRQGLKELQMFPDSFDGALIGAPAWDPRYLNPAVTRIGMYNLPLDDPKHINTSMFPVIGDEIMNQCDELDGVKDGIISAPELCTPNLDPLGCNVPGINQSACLNDAQKQTMRNVYGDYKSASGQLYWAGYSPGSEDQLFTVLGGTEPTPFGVGFNRFFIYDEPNWAWTEYNDSALERAVAENPGNTRADKYDLSDFKGRGGKIFMYHGMADGLLSTKGTIVYYDRVSQAMGGAPTDFLRLFLVPGMQHCWASVVGAPWNFAGAFQAGSLGNDTWSVPGFNDPQHDSMLALIDWVEKGKPVDSIIATTWKVSQNVSSGVAKQRPICVYPQKAIYDKVGDINQTSSWTCTPASAPGPSQGLAMAVQPSWGHGLFGISLAVLAGFL